MELNSDTIVELSDGRKATNFNATKLRFCYKDIERVEAGVLNRYKLLQELHLNVNGITELPPGIFHYLSELKEIDLSANKISSLHPQLFEANKKLEVISVEANEITELNEKELFRNLPELRELLFSGNKVKSFNFGCLKDSPKLQVLHFNDNDLREIKELENLKKLFPKLGVCRVHNNYFSHSYLQRVVESLERQHIKIWELNKCDGIKADSVYGFKCVPDDLYPYSLSEGRKVESKVSDMEAQLKLLIEDNTKLRIELNKNNIKIDELEAALAVHQQQNQELSEDHKDTKDEMWKAIQELQRQQAKSDAQSKARKVEENAK